MLIFTSCCSTKVICMSDIYLSTFKYKINSRAICSLFICLFVGAYLWHHTYCDTDFFRWHTVGDVFFLTTLQGMLGKIKKRANFSDIYLQKMKLSPMKYPRYRQKNLSSVMAVDFSGPMSWWAGKMVSSRFVTRLMALTTFCSKHD